MSDKPNPFLHLMQKHMTPKIEEKKSSESPNQGLTNETKVDTVISDASKQKVDSVTVTPQALQLLGATRADDAPTESNDSVFANDLRELASIDTEDMEPKERRESNLNVEAARLGKKLTLDSAEDVRSLCDRLDERLESVGGASLQGPALIDIRNYVQTIMVTLKSRPEFDEVLNAKDVRNVMKFVRAVRNESLAMREVKTRNKAVRSVKKEADSKKSELFSKAFNNVMGIPDFSKFNGGK